MAKLPLSTRLDALKLQLAELESNEADFRALEQIAQEIEATGRDVRAKAMQVRAAKVLGGKAVMAGFGAQEDGTGAPKPVMRKREAAIAVLSEVGVPMTPLDVAQLASRLYGVSLQATQLASLRAGDARAYRNGRIARDFLASALSAGDMMPVSGSIVLGNWSLERRLIGPDSDRANALHAAIVAAARFAVSHDNAWLGLVRTMARRFTLGNPDAPADVAVQAVEYLKLIEQRDEETRVAAARRARAILTAEQQVFGRPLEGFTAIEGRRQ